MATFRPPQEDVWYISPRTGEYFCVLSCEASETRVPDEEIQLQIQHFNGDLDEISLEEWEQLGVLPSEAPQSACGAYCIPESFESTETKEYKPDDMAGVLESMERSDADGFPIQ